MELNVQKLNVEIGDTPILLDIDFALDKNISVGVVGESGSGKTMFARSVMGLLPPGSKVSGDYTLDGEQVNLSGNEKAWKGIRGKKIGLIMQDPFTSLDPMQRCGKQITAGLNKEKAARFDLAAALGEVGLPDSVAKLYPYELSGGMRQRVVIAATLATEPEILIADEATTALDVITQKEILDLIDGIRKKRDMPLIIITHDLRIVEERTDYIAVFHDGQIAERGLTKDVIANPQDPYTKLLLEVDRALKPEDKPSSSGNAVILSVRGLSKRYGTTDVVSNVNIDVNEGECVGIVGQSGSGKTTLARCIIGLSKRDAGTVEFFRPAQTGGYSRESANKKKHKTFDAQIVFQDPYSSLNPALTVRSILLEALQVAGRSADDLAELLDLVEISPDLLNRKPETLSGGQRQRIAIARALAPEPRLLICDESVSALDVLVQAQILETLRVLREKKNLAILFITHDLAVVRSIAERSYVMHDAKIVEEGFTEEIFRHPKDPYTRELINAVPGLIELSE